MHKDVDEIIVYLEQIGQGCGAADSQTLILSLVETLEQEENDLLSGEALSYHYGLSGNVLNHLNAVELD